MVHSLNCALCKWFSRHFFVLGMADYMELELHPRMGKGVRFGSVVRYWGRQAGGGTTGSPRNQQDPLVWLVADETQPCPNPPSALDTAGSPGRPSEDSALG